MENLIIKRNWDSFSKKQIYNIARKWKGKPLNDNIVDALDYMVGEGLLTIMESDTPSKGSKIYVVDPSLFVSETEDEADEPEIITELEEKIHTFRTGVGELLRKSKDPLTMEQISVKMKTEKEIYVYRAIVELRRQGYPIVEVMPGLWHYSTGTITPKTFEIKKGGAWFKFALVSDTHGGSKHAQEESLHSFYDTCVSENIDTVVHGGDITHGLTVYKGQSMDLKPNVGYSYDDQTQYVIETYPERKGITTYFICGNHDEDAIKNSSADPGLRIGRERDDLEYLGMYFGNVHYGELRILLNHGGGSLGVSKSNKLQKAVEAIPRNHAAPHVFAMGHYHQFCLVPSYSGVDAFLPGGFEGKNNLLKRLNIYPEVGAWILEYSIQNDKIVDARYRRMVYPVDDSICTPSIASNGTLHTPNYDAHRTRYIEVTEEIE
jgi:predicted phosphodiesterase